MKRDEPASYKAVPIHGKGLGLVSTELIRDLSSIMANTPAVMADAKAMSGMSVQEFANLLSQAIDLLPEHHRNLYLNLSTHDVPANYSMKLYQIFTRNGFSIDMGDGGEDLHSVFVEGRQTRPT